MHVRIAVFVGTENFETSKKMNFSMAEYVKFLHVTFYTMIMVNLK